MNHDNAVGPTKRNLKRGTVEHIRFTSGGLGNQYITIDGELYATWFDLRTIRVRIGCKVEYAVGKYNAIKCPPATILRVTDW